MFGNIRKIHDLEDDIYVLKNKLETRDVRIAALEAVIADNHHNTRKQAFIFNFDAFCVFSIERVWKKDRAQTTIGFIHNGARDNESKLVEWHFDCDDVVHQHLCNQWQTWKNGACDAAVS